MKKIKSFCEGIGCFFCSFKTFKELKHMKSDFGMSVMNDSEIEH